MDKKIKKHTFALRSLGCKVNQYDAQVIREDLIKAGCVESGPAEADIVLINSCTVTDQADTKTRKLIKRLKRENPSSRIFVTGCSAVFPEDMGRLKALPEVAGVISKWDEEGMSIIVDGAGPALPRPAHSINDTVAGFKSHTRAFLKIQDGCDGACSFCKVNLVRGRSRSKKEELIISEIAGFSAAGFKEVVLTGICIGSWAGDDSRRLPELLKRIDGLGLNSRIRISSIEPDHIDDGLIRIVAGAKCVCRHFHIPLQSGSDRILKSMNRRYDAKGFSDLVGKIRALIPEAGITMDIIAGFPGETEKDFEDTYELVQRLKPSRLHVFRYSDREGTKAAAMEGKVPPGEAKARVEKLIRLGDVLQTEFSARFLGKEVEVLFEGVVSDGYVNGYTGEYVRVSSRDSFASPGDMKKVKIGSIDAGNRALAAE